MAIKNPATNKLVTSCEDIKKVSLKYAVDLLTNRSPKPEYETLLKIKESLHQVRMKEKLEDDITLTREFFDKSLYELKKSSSKYDFILKAGKDLKDALFQIFKFIWKEEVKPEKWRLDMIVQIHKRGLKDDLENYRNIHTRPETPKLFSYLVTSLMKKKLTENVPRYQIGALPGHRSQEHLFCMRSLLSYYNDYLGKPVIISLFDVAKFFDRENLIDAMDALHRCKVRGKLYRLIYMLNKDTVIQVKTGVGMTDKAETGETVSQGTPDSGIVSSASIGIGVNEVFSESKDEIVYGDEMIQPLIFQDDLARACTSVDSLIKGNILMEQVMEGKLLDFNLLKSIFMVVGNKKIRKKIVAELSSQTINLCGKPMREVESEKWLGDHIHCLGNDQSVITTVKKRYGLAMSTIMDIKNIMEDTRTSVTGGLMSGIQMYELCVIPYILNNCDVWDNVPKEAIDILDKIQTAFYCYLFNTPRKGTPHAGLLWESGGTCMKLRILKKQLNFYHHLKNLDGQCLAKSITDIQSRNNYPGLIKVCEENLLNLGLSHLNPCEFSKQSWSRIINNKIKDENQTMILNKKKATKN